MTCHENTHPCLCENRKPMYQLLIFINAINKNFSSIAKNITYQIFFEDIRGYSEDIRGKIAANAKDNPKVIY